MSPRPRQWCIPFHNTLYRGAKPPCGNLYPGIVLPCANMLPLADSLIHLLGVIMVIHVDFLIFWINPVQIIIKLKAIFNTKSPDQNTTFNTKNLWNLYSLKNKPNNSDHLFWRTHNPHNFHDPDNTIFSRIPRATTRFVMHHVNPPSPTPTKYKTFTPQIQKFLIKVTK
jgi:hypothetical protein